MTITEILQHIHILRGHTYPLLVITGGEPTLQHKGVREVIEAVQMLYPNIHYIDIETNGTIPNGLTERALVDWIGMFSNYVVSPKPQTPIKNLIRLLLCSFKTNIYLKFVHDGHNLAWIGQVLDKLGEEVKLSPHNIILMSAGTSYKELHNLDKKTVEICKEYGWRFSPRIHSYLWGLQRGK
jgi:organic radical activating enzyme